MKLVRTIAGAALSLFIAAAAFAQSEGVAEFKGTVHTDKNQTIPSQGKVFLSKAAVRVEWQTDLSAAGAQRKGNKTGLPSNFRMVMIQKLSEPDRTYIVNDERRTYAVQMIAEKREKTSPERTWKVQKLGADRVAGFSCQKALLTAPDGDQTEVCVTSELIPSSAWLMAWNRREEQSTPFKALKDSGLNGFPVRWIFRSGRDQQVASTVELVRFDRKSVPASLFEIPPGYRKVDSMMETFAATPEQEKAMRDARAKMNEALEKMTPEERKQYEEMMKKYGQKPQK